MEPEKNRSKVVRARRGDAGPRMGPIPRSRRAADEQVGKLGGFAVPGGRPAADAGATAGVAA